MRPRGVAVKAGVIAGHRLIWEGTSCLFHDCLGATGGLPIYVRESLKKTFETVSGINKPSTGSARSSVRRRKPRTVMFKDDGQTPNNPQFPFICYRGAVGLTRSADPAAVFEQLFEANGWVSPWRDGIYDYLHYHSRTHEVLGVARGKARVRFGGDAGKIIELQAGDAVPVPPKDPVYGAKGPLHEVWRSKSVRSAQR